MFKKEEENPLPSCPLCGEKHSDIVGHLRGAHGPRSLRIKQVKRFLAGRGFKLQKGQ